ncbi:probable histone-lysine N-methyltransferase CG1716 [Calliphora vicina]|uniref:probable histone-lysine N-methyltransferase CG1716 n=1 Tax=Calliphora vicina TaxID=7373 RepID=UPI00325B2FA1
MDANANQRKRGGRLAKNASGNECMSPPQSNEQNEVMDVSAVAISPTLEDHETTTNAPTSECRRSSRKKIIKFDVRDLLNKNRRTHKIQIEARIDSNAPTTSKAATAGGHESANPKSSSTVREDLLSKQKTFLEKSAIFRRYSISQDHKPPPPPLPMPPLLSKGNDNKDAGHSGNANSRRLSRTQEFFSNVMIKPKQTTSLIVAQIESNTPYSSVAAKRKNLNKSLELQTKAMTSSETESSPVVQQRKRGRPAKFKTQTSTEAVEQEKKITPEKAKNWKEYKACMAQQSDGNKEEPDNIKSLQQDEQQSALPKSKQDKITKLESMMINLEDTQQSDISKSEDDDGNFSGFKTSGDDLSCDSPVLEKVALRKVSAEVKESVGKKVAKTKENQSISKTKVVDPNQVDKPKESSLKGDEEKQIEQICSIKDTEMETSSTAQIETKSKQHNKQIAKLSLLKESDNKIVEITTKTEPKESSDNKIVEISTKTDTKESSDKKIYEIPTETKTKESSDKKIEENTGTIDVTDTDSPKKEEVICTTVKTVLQDDKDDKEIMPFKRNTRSSPEIFEKKDTEERITRRSQTKVEREENRQVKTADNEQTTPTKADKHDNTDHDDTKEQTTSSAGLKETEITDDGHSKQPIRNVRRQLRKEDTKDIPTTSAVSQDDKTKAIETQIEENVENIILETNKPAEESKTITCLKTPTKLHTVEVEQLKTPDILSEPAQQIVEECTTQSKLSAADVLLLTSQMSSISQHSTPPEETMKSFSRTSSSSESENASERSSYSSDPSSSTSSSSGRSYKSGDKLRVSLKRISLPKSPSTSSQTSTSEELNCSQNSDVFKKKPPMGKRSKRLQKKFVEMLEGKDDSENIDDCFHSITSEQNEENVSNKDDDKELLQTEEQVSNEQINIEVCVDISNVDIEDDKSTEIVTQSLVDVEVLEETSENIDLVSTESSNIKEKIVKRKSLRNRKDNSSEEKDEEVDKPSTNEVKENVDDVKEQLKTKIQNTKQKETISPKLEKHQQEENIEKCPEKATDLQKISESDQSEESDENKPKRRTRNDQSTKQQPQRQLNKKRTSPILQQKVNKEDKTTLQEENITDNVEGTVSLEANEQELEKYSDKDKSSMQNKSIAESNESERLDKQEKSHTIPSTRSKAKKEEINEKETMIQTGKFTDIEAKEAILKELSAQSLSKQTSKQKHESISDVIEIETSKSSTDKNKSLKDSPIKIVKEKFITSTPTKSKTNKEETFEKESNIEAESPEAVDKKETQSSPKLKVSQKNEFNADVMIPQTSKIPADKSKSPEEILYAADKGTCGSKTEMSSKLTTRSKTNKVEISTKVSMIEKDEDFTKSELMPERSSEAASERSTSPKEKSSKTNEEIKIFSTRSKSIKDSSTKEPKIPAENVIEEPKETSSKTDEQINILSTRSKSNKEPKIPVENLINEIATDSQTELMVEKSTEVVTTRSKSPKENSTKTTEESSAYTQEKNSKILSTRSKTNKEEISTRETKMPAEKTTQDELKTHKLSKTARDRSESPKENTTKIDEENKILSTRSKTNKAEMSTNETKIQIENLIEKPIEDEDNSKSVLKSDLMTETTRDRSKSPKESTTKTDDDTKIVSTRSKTKSNINEKSTQGEEVLKSDLILETTRDRSKSPKEKSSKVDEEPKILSTRSKTNKEDISTKETKIEVEKTVQEDLIKEKSSETSPKRSKSPKETSTKNDEETKIFATRSKTIKEDISTKESKMQADILIGKPTSDEIKAETVSKTELIEGNSSDATTERSKSPKEKLTATSEEKSTKIASPRRKNNKKDTAAIETNMPEKPADKLTTISLVGKELENANKSKNKSMSVANKSTTCVEESAEITAEKEISEHKCDQITSTRSKTNKEETSPITPTRSRTKKANILVDEHIESPKPAAKICTPTTSTTLIPAEQADSTKTSLPAASQEKPTTLNKDTNISPKKVISNLHAEASKFCQIENVEKYEIVTRASSKSPPCSKVTLDIDTTPSSAKRKSLRNQKDINSPEDLIESTSDTVKLLEESSPANLQQVETLPSEEQQVEEKLKATKRKGRKSRFKNLHSSEVESETESSNGKNTPIEEIMQRKLKETPNSTGKEIETQDKTNIYQTTKVQPDITQQIKETDQGLELKANEDVQQIKETELKEDNQATDDVSIVKDTSANLLSSQIQNVSIETNTLLDILRRVQSNTEAALKASKSPLTISKTENDNTSESLNKVDIEESVKNPLESNISETNIQECAQKSQDLLKIPQELKSCSPTRSDTESPLSLKKMHLSPARSDTSSPSTLKKIQQSPTRSDSSSPLTLKKVTRRYERRSRRGEDSANKTLEETFAEIAEQSTKAVLAAKEFDLNEEQTANENSLQEITDINTIATTENEQIVEIFTKIDKSSDDQQEVQLNVEEKVDTLEETLPNVLQLPEFIENIPNVIDHVEIEIKTSENAVELQETTKVITTPARRGRKPKNRSLEAPPAKEDTEVKNPTKTQMEIKEVIEQKLIETADQKKLEETPSEVIIQKPELNNENKISKSKKSKPNSSITTTETACITTPDELPESLNKSSPLETNPTETSVVSPTPMECSLKPIDDTNETKASGKKSIKKRDTSKGLAETVTEDTALLDAITSKEKEEEVRTPKQAAKKRDTSLTKSETKSVGKKLPKKTKNEEEDDTLTKTTPSVVTTTPPPSKRGRKPKNQQQETPQTTTSSKKKNKKETATDHIEYGNEEKRKAADSETDSLNSSLDRSLDEKLAKKKRQKKLKEAFEAALTDDIEKAKEALKTEISSSSTASHFGLTLLNNSPTPERRPSTDIAHESLKITCITPVEAEEDPDPLKDIEKFIADGVNLLKKDYKLDEDSVDDVIATSTPSKTNEILQDSIKSTNEEIKPIFNTFETPADTPLNTPSVTPPPKSPTSIESTTPDENSGVRRSHRIKLITKTPKALVGRGLVKDKERFSIKDDVETKSHYTLDDHLTDLAEVEAKNAKFLKEMEERLSNFQVIKENEYWCERVISREARKMICDCFLTHEEEERGELGCGEDCLNRLLMIECGSECNVKERCTNKRFQKLLCSPCRVFRTEKKGFGIMADIEILPGEFILEYVGEVIDTDEFEKRRVLYSQDKNRHYYFMALRSDAIIDATIKGNISRFINHSCDPNAETQKWTVNGELRIGFFSRKSIMPGEEITFNYQYQRYGREAQRCYCESANCTGWIGQEPTSDEGEQLDDDDEYESEDEEEADTSNLLVQDDDEDSDASVADPEEVQKQLEMAAAQAEVELAPLQLLEEKAEQEESTPKEGEPSLDANKSESEEDSKSKFKKLLSKMAEKVAAKQKQSKREQKLQRKKKSKESSSDLTNKLRFLEDPDIEDEVEFLKECGLKNQSDTLRLSRLMVRAKLVQTRLNLLEILRQGDLPCRRLFLDYHGLRLVHGWMSEDAGNMQIRLALLQTLDTLPIANKTVLTDSKVMQMVRNWCGHNTNLSPSEDSSSSNSNSQDVPVPTPPTNFEEGSDLGELQKLALKLITTWEGLPEIFRIPKKERIEQMKEHEREADRQYAANAETQENIADTDHYRRDRFGRSFNKTINTAASSSSNRFVKPNNGNHLRTSKTTPKNDKNLSKAQRREMFAAKVARDEAEKRLSEERREFETKCRFFGLDPKKTRQQDIPFCVNPATGQWFSIERKPITTPPSYAHVQVPVKHKSTDPNDYQLPAVCSSLPPQWKYAITPQGKIYYYHVKHRIPQWEPPSAAQLQQCEIEAREDDSESELINTAGEDSSDDDEEVLIGMDAAQLKAYIDRKVEVRRQKRYQRLVDERCISPRREEDRIYNQIEVRKYKENKEKIRKRKEEIRRKRAEALRQTSLNMCTLGSITDTSANPGTNKLTTESDEESGVLPIQDYLLSSDEDVDLKAEVNSPLIDKIVEGDKIVDELDALTTKRKLKRPLPPHRDLNEPSTSSSSPATTSALSVLIARQEYKKRKLEKKEKRKPKEQDAKYRKNKEKFRCEIAGIIVHHLKPYRKDTCTVGRIQSNEDFNHLARKLTHFVMIKELKYCESVGQTLVVTESVKSKSREFIKKYMAKYGDVYVKPSNDPDFKDIPFTL